MPEARRGRRPTELSWLLDELDSTRARLRTLEAPDAQQLNQTVAKLAALIDDIQAQLDDYIANGTYNKAQIDTMFAATETLIDAKVAAYVASYMAGNVSIGGALNVIGTVTLPGARGLDLTSAPNRIVAWLAGPTDNRLGHT